MHFTILGYGVEGKSTYLYLRRKFPDAEIEVRDIHTVSVPHDVIAFFGATYLDNIPLHTRIFRSPGVLPYKILERNPNIQQSQITSQTQEFFHLCPAPIIGVTGTKGKGTTSTLIYEILKAAGKSVFIIGNIGSPALDILDTLTPEDFVIYELSSFQLIDLTKSPHISVVLNITPEHLDIHRDIDEYMSSKKNIVSHQVSTDYAVINTMYDVSRSFTKKTVAQIKEVDVKHFPSYLHTKKFQLRGEHNLENIMAAVEVAEILDLPQAIITKTVENFKGLEHRLEYCGTYHDVSYYNDSYGTTPETAIAALKAFSDKNITLFLGGSYKGSDYSELLTVLSQSTVTTVILIPEMGPKIWKEFTEKYPKKAQKITVLDYPSTMKQAVQLVSKHTQKGGIVLLSCGCASFGIFKNYKERGNLFKEAVSKVK